MLKAAVVYMPGSGGNLITRSLALADHTVAYVPESLAKQQPTLTLQHMKNLNYTTIGIQTIGLQQKKTLACGINGDSKTLLTTNSLTYC